MADLEIDVKLSSIQDLSDATELSGGDFIAVAQLRNGNYETRKASVGSMLGGVKDEYLLPQLCSLYANISGITQAYTLSADVGNPYVLSSISFENGLPVSASGYRISSIMSVESLCSDAQVPVAVIRFGEVSATIGVPKPKDNLVTFARWNLT